MEKGNIDRAEDMFFDIFFGRQHLNNLRSFRFHLLNLINADSSDHFLTPVVEITFPAHDVPCGPAIADLFLERCHGSR